MNLGMQDRASAYICLRGSCCEIATRYAGTLALDFAIHPFFPKQDTSHYAVTMTS